MSDSKITPLVEKESIPSESKRESSLSKSIETSSSSSSTSSSEQQNKDSEIKVTSNGSSAQEENKENVVEETKNLTKEKEKENTINKNVDEKTSTTTLASEDKEAQQTTTTTTQQTQQTQGEQTTSKNTSSESEEGSSSQYTPGTVFADPTNFTIKHPLQNRWTMWFDNPRKKTSLDTWGSHLKKIADFDTVEDFWRLHNNIAAPSTLPPSSNYHIFKYGIEPKWEDPENQRGGQWSISFPSKQRKEKLDNLWLYAILACIGEAFGDDEDEVCGCVVSIRKAGDRIALWTKTATKEQAATNIGRQLKRVLELEDRTTITYQYHSDNMRRSSSFMPSRYEV